MTQLNKGTLDKLRNVTQEEYFYGDFNNNGIKNIDDPKPFDPKSKGYPEQVPGNTFYTQARYGGGEVLLSDELRAIEKYNNQYAPYLKKFLRNNPDAYGRIKTVPSTMKKLRERYITNIGDISGAAIETKNREEVYERVEEIKKKYPHDKSKTDDFYKDPKNNVYYAYHLGLKNNDKVMELQIKSKPMGDLHKDMHEAYKKDPKSLNQFKDKAKKLYDKGF